MENMELCDVWRIFNPDFERYTWRQRQPEIHCRLDFFLVSQSILGKEILEYWNIGQK